MAAPLQSSPVLAREASHYQTASFLTIDDIPNPAIQLSANGEIQALNEAMHMLLHRLDIKHPTHMDLLETTDLAPIFLAFKKSIHTQASVKTSHFLSLKDTQYHLHWWVSPREEFCLITGFYTPRELQPTHDISGHMAAALAHEIRNPLLSIKGAAQLLKDAVTSKEDSALAELVQTEATRIEALMQAMDPLSAAPKEAMHPLNIHSVLEQARQSLAAMAPHIAVTCDYDPSLPEISGDASRLQQVVINLLKNAMEALDDPAIAAPHITLKTRIASTSVAKRQGELLLPVCVTISDNGKGIADATWPDLCTPFTSKKPGGKGLGLSICASIMQQHGGIIEPIAQEKGACFALYFPLPAK